MRTFMLLLAAVVITPTTHSQICSAAESTAGLPAWNLPGVKAPALGGPAYNGSNPYATNNPPYCGECTWYVWGRTLDRMSVSLKESGDAYRYASLGHPQSVPAANSLAIWDQVYIYNKEHDKDPSKPAYILTGHIAYVESYDSVNKIVYFTEANIQPAEKYDGLKQQPVSTFENRHLVMNHPGAGANPGSNHFWGYLYLSTMPGAHDTSAAATTPPVPATKPPVAPPVAAAPAPAPAPRPAPVAAAPAPAPRPAPVAARAPLASTNGASSVGTSTATVAGTVNPGGADTRYTFLYGTNPSLAGAAQTPQYDVGAGTNSLTISANLGGLSANTTYYFQLTASSTAGVARGAVSSFHTAAPPAPPARPPAAQTPTPTAKPKH